MSVNDVRTQRQREQDERPLSVQRNNAYFSFKATENNASSGQARAITPNLTEFLNVASDRASVLAPPRYHRCICRYAMTYAHHQ